jgi:gliding motility-associated-like protein
LKNIRHTVLAVSFFLFCTTLFSQNLHWVGGSGFWNDPNHWSLTPGGQGGVGIPDSETDVFFDDQSFEVEDPVITIQGDCHMHSMHVSSELDHSFSGNGHLHISTGISLAPLSQWAFEGTSTFSVDALTEITLDHLVFQGPVEFVGTGAPSLNSHLLIDQSALYVDCPGFLSNGNTIVCGSFNYDVNAPADLIIDDSKVYISQGINIADAVRVEQENTEVQLSTTVTEENIHPGDVEYILNTNRTNTCGVGPSETPFTIEAVVVSDFNGEDVSCNGSADGETFVTVSGGIGPFTFQWIGGVAPGFTQNYQNLEVGTYTVLVTDEGQGITCVDNVQVTEPAPITVFSFNYTPPSCDGLCNGIGTPIVIGGVPGYDFLWTTGEITQTATMLCEGSNTMTVTDQNGCSYDSTFVVDLEPIFLNVDITNIICSGQLTGSAVSNPTGGDGGPYLFDWSTGDIDNDITNQAAGTYTLEVTDGGGCSVDTTFEITEEPPMLITLDDLQDVSCGGLSDGSIDISISGGLAPYIIAWTGPNAFSSSDEDISDLETGDYDLVVTDDNGCQVLASYFVDSPPELQLDFDITHITCASAMDGEIDMTITGGIPPYIIAWTGPAAFTSSDEDLTGLDAGSYEVTVTDDNGCFVVTSVDVDEPTPIDVVATVTPPSCAGTNDGSIELDITGGTAPYSTDWTGPNAYSSTDEDITGLEPGTYDLTVTDDNGCEFTGTYDITDPDPFDVVFDITEISCNGEFDGAIDATISGGTPPYQTDWTGPNAFTSSDEDITGLEAGTYDLIITDDSGCQDNYQVVLNDPLAITLVEDITDASCGGFFDGAIDLTILGGTPGYIISWTGPNAFTSPDEDISNLEGGDYTVEVTDAAGCMETATYTVDSPPLLDATADVMDITCNGANDGSIDMTIIGGQPAYIISWTGPNAFSSSDEDISNLEAGTYDLIITDANGCEYINSFEITEADALDITVDTIEPTCNGANNGSITLTINGGVEPYDILWNTTDTGTSITDLVADTYSVTVTDAAGCIVIIDPIVLNEAPAIDIDLDVTSLLCFGDMNGAIDATITGGTPPYIIGWTGPNAFVSMDEDIADLEAGDYTIIVVDMALCADTASATIDEPEEIIVDADITEIGCAGEPGAIDLTITGGVPALDISWTGPNAFTSTDEDIADLEEGTYEVTIIDQNGCTVVQSYDLQAPVVIMVDDVITPLDCSGDPTGAIDITISGGLAPYVIQWTGPNAFSSTDEDIADLEAGAYDLSITDDNGCLFEASYFLDTPQPLEITANVNPPLCAAGNTGSIDLFVSGGTPFYEFSWTGPNAFTSPSEDISNLEPGTYTLNILDQGGCSFDATYELEETSGINIEIDATDINCAGELTGSIDITVTGGTPDYTFDWSGPGAYMSSDEDLSDLGPGSYDLIVTDANGCEEAASVMINETIMLEATVTMTQPTCGNNNGSATVMISGGSEPYIIVWSDADLNVIGIDPTISDLMAGLYYVSVEDQNGCFQQLEVNLSDSDVAELEASITDVQCFGLNNGAIDLTITGGNAPFTIEWTGPNAFTSSDEDIADLEPGDYSVVVTDDMGCVSTATYTVNEPGELLLDADITDIFCNGANDGAIDLSIFGGTADFSISWTGPNSFVSTDEDISGLEPGDYFVQVTDANLCYVETNFTVIESTLLDLTFDFTDVLCAGDASGWIDMTVNGGTAPYDFSWTGPGTFTSNNEDLTDIEAGDYTVNVTDDNGCSAEATISILANDEIVIDIDVTQPTCNEANGSLEANVTGGTVADDYFYFWYDISNGGILISTDSIATGLASGIYYLEVFDDAGCFASQDISLSDAVGTLDADIQDVLCFGQNNGTIDLTVGGMTDPLAFDWSGPSSFTSTDEDIMDLFAGDYSITVTDALGCQQADVFTVSEPLELEALITAGNILCNGANDGAILLTPSGGTPLYTFEWDGPNAFTSTDQNLTDLEPGCYDLILTDANFCFLEAQICIEEPEELAATAVIDPILCFGDSTGAIDLTVTGGTPPHTFSWVGPNSFTSDQEDLVNLLSGSYDLQITDLNGCQLDTNFFVGQSDEILVDVSVTTPSCPGDSNGTISLEISGGSPDYTVNWSSENGFSSTDEDIADLEADAYIYEITDMLACMVSDTVFVNDPDSLQLNPTVNDISCFGEVDGNVVVEILGGTAPYVCSWTGPNDFTSSDCDIDELEAGTYELVVSDLYMCSATIQIQIVEPPSMEVTLNNLENASCPTSFDGLIDIDVTGGSEPYDFLWVGSNNYTSMDEDAIDLGPGAYDLLVTDSSGCTFALNTIPIIAIGGIEVSVPDDFADCPENGPWEVEGTSDTGIDQGWYDESGTQITGSSILTVDTIPGTYTFIYEATDGLCFDSDTIIVIVHDPAIVDAGEEQFVFLEEPFEIGGDPTTDDFNTVLWTPNELLDDSTAFNPLGEGLDITTTFTVIATTEFGCVASDTVVVNIIPEITIPDGFTPNQDGQNELWDILNIGFYPNTVVEVYNRWGDQLWRSEGAYIPWDGTYEGELLPIGTYYYIINVNEPEFPDAITGPVTIMR